MFTPETVELPGTWPACRMARCGSTRAVARIEAPYGAVAVLCENGHLRSYRKKDEFRDGGRYAGLFSASALGMPVAGDGPERRLEPSERRRAEVLEDAERCALCRTPPAEHPFRPDAAVRSDREVWAWFQRWRPAIFAQLAEALAIVHRTEPVTFGNWRLKIPATLREVVVRELSDSVLEADLLIPAARLAPFAGALTKRELDFAASRLLVALCRRCNSGRWRARATREEYLGDYVTALYDGDERLAHADAAAWRTMESLASRASRLALDTDQRSA